MARHLIALALAASMTLAAHAQQEGESEPPRQEGQPERPPPTLDELLGLPEGDRRGSDPTRAELDRRLAGEQLREQFAEAVSLMSDVALRIQADRDTGLITQRVQDDIVRRLGMVIESAERMRQQQSQSRSRPQRGEQDQRQAQPNQPREASTPGQRQGENRDERDPPAGRAAELGPEAAARMAAWGALPARVRDALSQGDADRFSSLYRRLTERYYRRLAEEVKR